MKTVNPHITLLQCAEYIIQSWLQGFQEIETFSHCLLVEPNYKENKYCNKTFNLLTATVIAIFFYFLTA